MMRPWLNQLFVALLCGVALYGCQTTEPKVNPAITGQLSAPEQNKGHSTTLDVPEAVMDDILSGQSSGGIAVTDDPHFNVVAQDVEVRPFFASLVEGTAYSVIIHPQVSGKITLDLKDVTLFEAIEAVKELYGFDIRKKGKIITVRPPGLRTETFAVNYLMMTRKGTSSVTVSAGGVSQAAGKNNGSNNLGTSNNLQNNNLGSNGNLGGISGGVGQFSGSNISTTSETDFWKDLQKTLQTMIGMSGEGDRGNGRTVVVSPMTGLVTVRAYPGEINTVREFLQRSEQTLRRQVILEAKIVEVSLNDDYQQGINWQQALAHVSSTDFIFSNTAGGAAANTITAGLGGVTNIRFNNADFTGVISLLQTQGNVQILSSPRVTATNNQKAVIKVGQDEYFVTDVSTTTTTGTTTTTTPELTLTPFFSGIALDVTPQINEHNEVILHIHPSVTETSEQEKVVSLSGDSIVLPLAQSNIRESDTIIRARSGEIVVIGGLMQSTLSDTKSKTPGLGDIPLIGELFTQKAKVERKKELVILVKATVVGAGTWKQQLKRSSDLLKTWYTE